MFVSFALVCSFTDHDTLFKTTTGPHNRRTRSKREQNIFLIINRLVLWLYSRKMSYSVKAWDFLVILMYSNVCMLIFRSFSSLTFVLSNEFKWISSKSENNSEILKSNRMWSKLNKSNNTWNVTIRPTVLQ